MTKHTPGPWEKYICCGSVKKNGLAFPLEVNQDRLEGESWIGMRDRIKPELEAFEAEKEANERVAASAPELLRVLEVIQPELKGSDLGHIVDAAIALAKGE